MPRVFTFILLFSLYLPVISKAQVSFEISMPEPANHLYHVVMEYAGNKKTTVDLNMSAWTPGFYEIVDFAAAVSNFHVTNMSGDSLLWQKTGDNTWTVNNPAATPISVSYDVKAVNKFIGNIYLDEQYGYIIPGALLLYINEELRKPVIVKVNPYSKWPAYVATGLDPVKGPYNSFKAKDFDELFDSPLLMGNLETLPSFTVKGIPHQFVAHNPGEFDRTQFMTDLQKIVESGIRLIGDIPYSHYTFLGVGIPGGGTGGIEHLNSASLMIGTKKLIDAGFYSFLAHEYFHLYNVKRIRPVELGPFDYSKENYTNLLWISEGFTNYYEYIIMRDAGLMSDRELLDRFEGHIHAYEDKPGHLYQSANEASRTIWAIRGNPFARTEEEQNRTISVYDKGCILGVLLDLKIRHETGNRKSLDHVMRALYTNYYKNKKRGFTEKEFQQQCEQIAGVPLKEFFSYTSTVAEVNYKKYFLYAGLDIDTTFKISPVAKPTPLQTKIYNSWMRKSL